jgi:hypothetical protein
MTNSSAATIAKQIATLRSVYQRGCRQRGQTPSVETTRVPHSVHNGMSLSKS